MLTYLNCHVCIVFMMVFTLVGRLVPCSDLLVFSVSSDHDWLLLAISIITVIQRPAMAVYQGRKSRLLTIRPVYWQR